MQPPFRPRLLLSLLAKFTPPRLLRPALDLGESKPKEPLESAFRLSRSNRCLIVTKYRHHRDRLVTCGPEHTRASMQSCPSLICCSPLLAEDPPLPLEASACPEAWGKEEPRSPGDRPGRAGLAAVRCHAKYATLARIRLS